MMIVCPPGCRRAIAPKGRTSNSVGTTCWEISIMAQIMSPSSRFRTDAGQPRWRTVSHDTTLCPIHYARQEIKDSVSRWHIRTVERQRPAPTVARLGLWRPRPPCQAPGPGGAVGCCSARCFEADQSHNLLIALNDPEGVGHRVGGNAGYRPDR